MVRYKELIHLPLERNLYNKEQNKKGNVCSSKAFEYLQPTCKRKVELVVKLVAKFKGGDVCN